MSRTEEEINSILSDWDPLDLGKPISEDEYRGFVPQIQKYINSEEKLLQYLEELVVSLGIVYDRRNEEHRIMLKEVMDKLIM